MLRRRRKAPGEERRVVAPPPQTTRVGAARDPRRYVASLVPQRVPDPPPPVALSERSLFAQGYQPGDPGASVDVTLGCLLRDDGNDTLVEWFSSCVLRGLTADQADAVAFGTARGGHVLCANASTGKPCECDWSDPVPTNLPDSRSLTAAGLLPDGTAYLLGNQLPRLWDRDPLTLALAPDGGTSFSTLVAVRAGAPNMTFPAFTKGPGYQYPDATVAPDGTLIVVYSVNKEEIAVTRVPGLAASPGGLGVSLRVADPE